MANEADVARQKGVADEKLGTGGYACKVGDEWKLPINNAAHARNATARYNQAEGCQTPEVKARICAACKEFGVDDAFEKGGFCYIGVEKSMEIKKEEMEQWFKDAEKRIIDKVTEAITAKKTTVDVETSLKAMEERILTVVKEKLAEKKEPTQVEKTLGTVQKNVNELHVKVEKLRDLEKRLKEEGEDTTNVQTRIAQLEKQSEDIIKSVESVVERKLGKVDERLAAIENIPELKSPATIAGKPSVQRGMGGFGDMLEAARRGN